MKLTIDIPEPRFKPGDFVWYTKKSPGNNPGEIFSMRVIARVEYPIICVEFCWTGLDHTAQIKQADYLLSVQHARSEETGFVVRPGTCWQPSIEQIDADAESFDYKGEVWLGDNAERDAELSWRMTNWDQEAGAYRGQYEGD